MMTSPKRRWYQFSLRTMFVGMTVLCVYLGWQASTVRERKAVRAWLIARGDMLRTYPNIGPFWFRDHSEPISTIRHWLGDLPIDAVAFQEPISKQDAERVYRAYPDTDFYGWEPE